MNAKKNKKVEEEVEFEFDTTPVEEVLNERPATEEVDTQPVDQIFVALPGMPKVYERVTNGGKPVAVLKPGTKVRVLDRKHNWFKVQLVDRPEIVGFVQPRHITEEVTNDREHTERGQEATGDSR
jgi:hypothetical protein